MQTAPDTQPSIAQHPLVSTLFWVWNRINAKKEVSEGGEVGTGTKTPPMTVSGGEESELGVMWNEEFGGHLDLYAEYVQDLKGRNSSSGHYKDKVEAGSSSDKVDQIKDSQTPSPGSGYAPSPGWGWYMPITPPRDSSFGMPFGNNNSPANRAHPSKKSTERNNISGTGDKNTKIVTAFPISVSGPAATSTRRA
jgi:hypothetical protein